MLGVAVVNGTARVSISIILAVNHSALDRFLNLMSGSGKRINQNHNSSTKLKTNIPFISIPVASCSHQTVFFGLYLSAKNAVDHDNDETFQRVEDGEEDLEEGGAAVSDG